MPPTLQDIRQQGAGQAAPARAQTKQSPASILAEELLQFIASDAAAQDRMRRNNLLYGTDQYGNYLDERGGKLGVTVVDIAGKSAGALQATDRALERINLLFGSAATGQSPASSGAATGFESPEEEPYGTTMGSSMQKEYRTESEANPWVESVRGESSEAGEEGAAGEGPARAAPSMEDVGRSGGPTQRAPSAPPSEEPSEEAPDAVAQQDGAPATGPARGPYAILQKRYQSALATAQRTKREHEKTEQELRSSIRRTFILVVVLALLCAALADILSVFDFGWVISWSIPLFTGMMLVRIKGIENSEKAIAQADEAARQAVVVVQQRLRQAGVKSEWPMPGRLASAKSYIGTYLRDTIAVQLMELIPVVDVLPMYLGQVVKMILHQNAAYLGALESINTLKEVHVVLQGLQERELVALRRLILAERVRSFLSPMQSLANAGRRAFATS